MSNKYISIYDAEEAGGGTPIDPADTLPDGGVFDIGSGSVHDLAQGKYYVVDWDGTQDMPAITPEVGVLTKIDNFDGANGQRIIFTTGSEKLYTKTKLAGGWEQWAFYANSAPLAGLANNEMVKWDSAVSTLVGTGDTNTDTEVNYGTKVLRAASGAFDAGTIDMVGYQLNERGGYIQQVSKTTGRTFISVDYQVDNNGTQPPLYDSRGALISRQIKQADDTQTITGLTSYDVTPDASQDISQIYFKFVNPVDNFRARITSDVTGEVISYIPSRSQFDADEGVSLAAGEQTFSPETVLPELIGFPLTVEVFADQSIDVLGDALGNPWRAVDVQDIISLQLLTNEDVAPESISTSLIEGGLISEATPTTIDITAGSGRVVSIDANGIPTIIPVSWAAQSGIAINNIATTIATRIGVDENGVITQLPPEVTPEVARDYVVLGLVPHATGTIGTILNDSLKSQELYAQLVDSIEVLGITRKSGIAVSGNTDLTFDKTAGELQGSGAGNNTGNAGQNIVNILAEAPSNFTRFLGSTNDIESSGQTLIDPGFYDNGTGTKVAIGSPTQQATIQYVYQSIIEPGGVLVMYGQTVYSTLSDALLNADLDVVNIPVTVEQETNLIARIVVASDATNLQDGTKATILSGVKFGAGVDGTLSGSISGGGDYLGAASSSLDEIHTFADASGKVGKAASDVSAVSGVIKRISASSGVQLQSSNGVSKVEVTPNDVIIAAKNLTDASTTELKVSDSNGNSFGGGVANLDSGNSVGYKTSQGGVFRNQMYYVADQDATHLSHNGSNQNPNADIVMNNTSINTEFSGAEAMEITDGGQHKVNGTQPQYNLSRSGTTEYTWEDSAGTMRMGRSGFAATDARLEMEFGFTSLRGGDASFARLLSGSAIVDADGPTGDVDINSNKFPQGVNFVYPSADGNAGDKLTTDGSGNLTLDDETFETINSASTLEYDNKRVYVDSSGGAFDLTLGDNPRLGERKLIWMGDNTNEVNLVSANPAFPIDPQTPPAESNIQGMWTLSIDFLDRFSTDRDMSNIGTGGAFVPIVVNGNNVNGFDFQGTAYLEATASGYAGILGGSSRSVTTWYQATTVGNPTTDQNIISWGEDIPNGGGAYWEIEIRGSQGYLWVNNRNAWRRYTWATLAPTNLFDGNAHHIAVTQSTANMGSVRLYIDGVFVSHDAQDTSPNCNTLGGNLLKIGAGYTTAQRLDGILYDLRLFNRALTVQEIDEIRNENILGGINISALNNDMVIDVTYNGSEWKLGVGTESLLSSVDGRLTALEASAMIGSGTSTTSSIVTFADDTGMLADNTSGVTVNDGLFVKNGVTGNMQFNTETAGGDITLKTDVTEVKLNETTGNIEFTDGGGGFSDNFFGRWRLRNPSNSPGVLLHNDADLTIGGTLWNTDDGGYLYTFTGTVSTPVGEVRLSDTQYKVTVPSIVNSEEAISSQAFQVNDQFSDAGTVTYYENVPAMINLLTDNGGSTPAPSATALSLHRSGIPTESYGNSARFDLSRYENAGTNMRTQLDIRLGHASPVSPGEGGNTPYVLRMRSSGEVSMPTTTAAFFPPVVTNTQMNAITPEVGAHVFNSDIALPFVGDGTLWKPLSSTASVSGKTLKQNNIAMAGVFQAIQSGTFDYYEVDGQAATPNFTNGAWVVDVGGTYLFNVRGWAFNNTGTENQARFYVGVNGNDYVSQPDVGIDVVTKDGSGVTLSGQVRLSVGDVVRIGYSVLSGNGWELDAFTWDVTRVGS